MPGISAALIDSLIAAFDPPEGRTICVATGHGHRGHPVLWSREFFGEIATLTGDTGARDLLKRHAGQVMEIEAGNDAPLSDIDTPEALSSYRV
jgi:molybdenum cofactor cytidylyltransferase